MRADRYDCDVLIVGLGPVGAALAALLARAGVTSIAVERDTEVYPLPRAAHFDHEVMRIFQSLGIAEAVAAHARPAPGYEFRTAKGELLLSFALPDQTPSGWSAGYMFHQPGLETALRDLIAASPLAEARLGWRFESLVQDAEGVTATVTGPDGPSRLRARYLVGCDGASSRVREAVGGGLFDFQFDEPWLVIDAVPLPGARMPETNLQICDPKRPTTCVLMGPGRHRWEFMLLPGETAEQMLEDDFIQSLVEPWDCGPVKLERKAVYRFHGLVAHRWRAGRVLLAGDAAHQTPPFAGQGMCSGIRDAVNLAWKLDAVLAGADEGLLDTYQQERDPHVRTLIAAAIGMGRVVCTQDPAAAAERDRAMLAQQAAGGTPLPPAAPAPFAEGCILPGSPAAGTLLPQPVRDGTRFDDLMGDGAWLVARTAPAAETPGLKVAALDRPEFATFRPDLEAWLDKHGAEAALVRPDRYVFGTGAPGDLVRAWGRALRPAAVPA